MAQQETGATQEPAVPDGTGQEGTGRESAAQDSAAQDSGAQEASGRHAATDDATGKAGGESAPAEAPTEKAEPEHADTPHHRSFDVGELAWRTGNVLATVIRTLALLLALVLVVNVVLVLVGVNPANGVAQFVATVANLVILGFRDLFVPANPVVMLIVNSLIAAIFWVFVGELASRMIRFLAARVK